jgi:hypothetical protein
MSFTVPVGVNKHFEKFWLNRYCSVARSSGYGVNAALEVLYTNVPYKKEFGSTPRMVGIGGGFQAEVTYTLKFGKTRDIQSKDVITDNTTGEQFKVDDLISGSHEILKAVSATRLTDRFDDE